jgi:8-oxo-dGTP pyrophosphatase MutT (NUDIX family)
LSDADASRALGLGTGGLAYWAAAIRESFEEAGLLVAYDSNQRVIALDQHEPADRFRQHRHALNAGKRGFIEILRE